MSVANRLETEVCLYIYCPIKHAICPLKFNLEFLSKPRLTSFPVHTKPSTNVHVLKKLSDFRFLFCICISFIYITINIYIGLKGEGVVLSPQVSCDDLAPWTEWGTCSRTCDGGVTYRTRRCRKDSPMNRGCRADDVQYSACNMQVN